VGIIPLIDLAFPGYPQGVPRGSSLMKIVVAAFALAACLLTASLALAQQPTPADSKAISDCLKKAESAGQFGAACIGIVADPCMEKSDKTGAKTKACAARELAVWTALSETAAKKVKAGGFKEISAAVAESEKGWTQLRDMLCPAFDKVDPGTLPGDAAYCRMQTTAHRALLLRRLGAALAEH